MDAKEYIEKSKKLCEKFYDEFWHCIDCPAFVRKNGGCKLKHNGETSTEERINLIMMCEKDGCI